MQIDFQELSLDVVAGTVLGSLGYAIELSIASLGPAFISSNATLYGAIVGVMLFAGSIFGKVGRKMYKDASSSSNEINIVNSRLDEIEGLVVGGLLGFLAYMVASVVASLPGSFLTASMVLPLSVLVGDMGFIGYTIPKLRNGLVIKSNNK